MTDNMREITAAQSEVTGHKGVYEHSWAVVIGINRYERHNPLTYAVADAASVAETLISRLEFPPQHVFLVLDPPDAVPERTAGWLARTKGDLGGFEPVASKAVIESLLVTTLPERAAGSDDRVLVYFAGHGAPRREPGADHRIARPYLIPAEGQPSRWDTCVDLKMLIEQHRYVAAKHMLYVLDACCAGLAGLVGRRSAQVSSRYERELLHRKARQCITAGTAEGAAADLGSGGHSPFTWHLLQVLRGEVRLGEDGLISTTTLTAHLKEAVGKEPDARQIPDAFPLDDHEGGDFIFSASKAPLTLHERSVLARLLVAEVGLRLEEPVAIELAATLWRAILDGGIGDRARAIEARRELARTHLLLGKPAEAREMLSDPSLAGDAESLLLCGLACLHLRDRARARAELLKFASSCSDHRYAAWARHAAESAHQRRRALLVGAGTTQKLYSRLRGVDNDVAALADLLTNGFAFDDIEILRGEQATAANLRVALAAAEAASRPDDTFLFYFTGHGAQQDDTNWFVTRDFLEEGAQRFSEHDLDEAMRRIPAQDKLVITDGCYLAPKSTRALGYRYLAGGRRDEATYEMRSPDGAFRGAFTLALERQVRRSRHRRIQDLWPAVLKEVTKRSPAQTPQYVGAPNEPFVNEESFVLQILELGQRGMRGPLSLRRLARWCQWLRRTAAATGMAPIWLGIGRALLAKRRYAEAVDVLASIDQPEARIPLLQARLLCDRHTAAADGWVETLAAHPLVVDDLGAQSATELSNSLTQLRQARRHALLVMMSAETGPEWTMEASATMTAVRSALVERCGFASEDVAVLCDPDKAGLLRACDDLTMRAGEHPTFFVFVGPGFDGNQVWIGSDSSASSEWHAPLEELRAHLPGSENLTSAVLVTLNAQWHEARTADAFANTDEAEQQPPLGRTTVVVVPVRTRELALPPLPPTLDRRWLVDALVERGHTSLSAQQWCELMQGAAYTIHGDGDGSLFSYVSARRRSLDALRVVEQSPLRRMMPLLQRLAAERELAAEACLQRAIVAGELGQYDEARREFVAAEDRHRQRHAARGAADGAVTPAWPELHYQRGRILYEAAVAKQAEYTAAIAELTIAVRTAGDHARAHYYRALAIRRLIEGDLERQASDSEQRYRDLGAPLGIDDDVSEPPEGDAPTSFEVDEELPTG